MRDNPAIARRLLSPPVLALVAVLLLPATASAAAAPPPGTERTTYRFGPVAVAPGANTILFEANQHKPNRDGFITRIRPDLVRADGSVPRVDVIHLHHGVWINASGQPNNEGGDQGGEIFFASGEEKTIMQLPSGYGYPVRASDLWVMNHMVHNLTNGQDQVWITYEIDFVPADSALGRTLKPVRPIWTDVEAGSAYPVFDTLRGGGGADGRYTYPDDAPDPYGSAPPDNVVTMDRAGTLVFGLGHLHPGGLWDDLDLIRKGSESIDHDGHDALHSRISASHVLGHRRLRRLKRRMSRPRRRVSRERRRVSRQRRRRAHRRLHAQLTRLHDSSHTDLVEQRDSVRIFRSEAEYYDPGGPISWDMSMTVTPPDWRVGVRKGDKLRISATYETERASWYESMGIILLYMSSEKDGPNPFLERVPTKGQVTHGHLPENSHYGGQDLGLPNPTSFPDGGLNIGVGISDFIYTPGDQSLPGDARNPPVVTEGQSLRFENFDWPANIFHTITACAPPCNFSSGISYPLADANVQFDSGQLGFGPPGLTAAAQRDGWNTPEDLKPGTYSYFCRVHPFMRGSFRVKPSA